MAGPLEMTIQWIESNEAFNTIVVGSLQACLIVAVTWIFCRFFFNRASLQNLVWRAAIVATMLVGPLHVTTGGWRVAIHTPPLSSDRIEKPMQDFDSDASIAAERIPTNGLKRSGEIALREADHPTELDENMMGRIEAIASAAGSMDETPSVKRDQDSRTSKIDWIFVAITAYFAMAAWLSLRLIYYTVRLGIIARNALPLTGISDELARQQARAIGLKIAPLVRRSTQIRMPLVCWLGQPQVLVPSDFDEWPVANRKTVLSHEFAHVARGDLAWELLSRLLCILYWFHPATFFLSRQLRRSCELATDEYVIRRGHQASEYAQGLLAATIHLAKNGDEKFHGSVLAMAGSTSLEERLRNVLSLQSLPWRMKSLCYAMSCLVVLLGIGSTVRIERASAQTVENASTSESSKLADGSAENNGASLRMQSIKSSVDWGDRIREAKASEVAPKEDNAILSIRGKVLKADGSVATKAIVLVRRWTNSEEFRNKGKRLSNEERWLFSNEDVLGRTTSDAEGTFSFMQIASPDAPSNYNGDWGWSVVARGEDGTVGWTHILHERKGNKIDRSVDVRLRPTTSIAGRFITPEGAPIADALVKFTGLERSFSDDYIPESDPDSIDLWYSQLSAVAKTDSDGQFRFGGIPIGPAATIGITHPGWVSAGTAIATDPKSQLGERRKLPPGLILSTNVLVASPATIVADPGFKVHGRVSDADGLPIQGALIGRSGVSNPLSSDRDGKFSVRLSKTDLERARGSKNANQIAFDIVGPAVSFFLAKRELVPLDKLQAGELIEFKLDQGVKVSGRVVTDTGEPIPDVRMQIAGPRDEKSIEAQTDLNGHYEFVAPKKDVVMFATLDTSGYQLPSLRSVDRASPDEAAKGPHLKLDLSKHDEWRCEDLVVKRTGLVQVRVLVSEGVPAKGADVVLKFERPYPDFGQGFRPSSPIVEEISDSYKTDENGEVTIRPKEGLSKSAYAEVSHRDETKSYLSKTPIEGATDRVIEVRLDRMWHVKGRVLKNGKPYPGIALSISSFYQSTSTDPRFRGMATSRPVQTTTSDLEGRYEFIVPPEGEYRVGLERKREENPGGSLISKSIEVVTEGEYSVDDIELIDVDGEISGTVVDKNGTPVSGARVSLMPAMGVSPAQWIGHYKASSFTTDANGNFSLRKIPEGSFQLSASGPRNPGERTSSVRITAKTGELNVQIVVDATPLPTPPRLTPKSITEPAVPSKK
jgi:beta-lactamase regulating signal transducer with metallopeptidase domain/uncharacterized GH25 family protein